MGELYIAHRCSRARADREVMLMIVHGCVRTTEGEDCDDTHRAENGTDSLASSRRFR